MVLYKTFFIVGSLFTFIFGPIAYKRSLSLYRYVKRVNLHTLCFRLYVFFFNINQEESNKDPYY